MPEWMKTASLVTPHGWALQAYVDLIVRGYGLMQVMQSVLVLCGFGLVFLVIGVWRFKFD
jgi:ABC-2 type transport system permease protein